MELTDLSLARLERQELATKESWALKCYCSSAMPPPRLERRLAVCTINFTWHTSCCA